MYMGKVMGKERRREERGAEDGRKRREGGPERGKKKIY
jgi:hypothetical protein